MKNSIVIKSLVTLICTVTISTAIAQISLGLKGGGNLSNLNGVDEGNYQSQAKIGAHFGAFLTLNAGRNFAIQPELVYSTQGATIENAGTSQDLKVNYVNFPIMFKGMTNKGLYLELGPQIGFKVGDAQLGDTNIEEEVKKGDFSVCAGIGFQGMKSPFGVGLRYNMGVSEVGDGTTSSIDNVDYKNGVLQLSLYWRLLGGGTLKK